ncbi:MAG: glycoside hydrolase family 30 beta sandwich domain-containing protein [Rudaea sp.]|uniref:glycoside hydrolase family 30 protein n=1 Tax=Rudaea sp. TaxID=2136325 RepID=UPI0039E2FDCF
MQVWLSTADGEKRLARGANLAFDASAKAGTVIGIDAGKRYQAMIGFGAAITDSSAWLIEKHMSAAQRDELLHELFGRGDGGLGIDFTRLTIGASDFSLRHYTLDDMPPGRSDPTLAHFSLTPAIASTGAEEVLPVVRAALAINPQLKVMASPWSAPAWMKTNGSLLHGTLRYEYHAAFADYLVKYVDAMAAAGVPIFALTVQNEPRFNAPDYPGMLLSAGARRLLIGQQLGPKLAQRERAPLIFDWDHNWDIETEPLALLADPAANRYVAAVAWHCYAGYVDAQTRVHDKYPDKDAYLTECSGGDWKPMKDDGLLTIVRRLLIGSVRGWSRGVLLWNLALDEHHGPHAGGCDDCRGLVTIDSKTGNYTRTVDYVALAHASRFVRPGAQRVESSEGGKDIDNVVFRNADDGSLVMIVANSARSAQRFVVREAGRAFAYTMPARSVATFVWR